MTPPNETGQRPDVMHPTGSQPAFIVYCRSWCPDCRRARDWLAQNGIEFVEVDVDIDADGRMRAEALNAGALHTPTFELGEETCIDFKPDRLREMLGMP